MNRSPIRILLAACAVLLVMALAPAAPANAAACPGLANCQDTGAFTAQLTDVRTSTAGRFKVVSVTLRFTNRRAAPMVLGYVAGSGLVTDDQGNRYEIASGTTSGVRGIGLIQATMVDPQFALRPSEGGDARLEFLFPAGNRILGTVFNLNLSVREIEALPGNQYRLGREHLLQFDRLANGQKAAAMPASADAPTSGTMSAATSAAISAPAAGVADGCAGAERCADAGPFTATIQQVTTSTVAPWHLVRFTLRLRNITPEPLVLAYLESSGTMTDELGNRYVLDSRVQGRVMGIGLTNRLKADPQLVLRPGESRTISVEYGRRVGRTQIGTSFSPDLVLQQLEILPSQQIRPARDFSLNYTDLAAGGTGVPNANAIKGVLDGLRKLTKPR